MPLHIASLNSGSNGNCYYISDGVDAVLIDAGISCLEIEKRLDRLGLGMEKLRAVFVSHEHTDHISGIPALIRKHKLPVYITQDTHKGAAWHIRKQFVRWLEPGVDVQIGRLAIIPFTKSHDAADPLSFLVRGEGVTIGVFTDIGKPCEQVIAHFRQCHAAFLEANYDEEMLKKGKYPPVLKKRISGDHGHLSNLQALELFLSHRPAFMSHLILAHLSKENNDPALVESLFSQHAGKTKILVASRYKESDLIKVEAGHFEPASKPKSPRQKTQVQLSLF